MLPTIFQPICSLRLETTLQKILFSNIFLTVRETVLKRACQSDGLSSYLAKRTIRQLLNKHSFTWKIKMDRARSLHVCGLYVRGKWNCRAYLPSPVMMSAKKPTSEFVLAPRFLSIRVCVTNACTQNRTQSCGALRWLMTQQGWALIRLSWLTSPRDTKRDVSQFLSRRSDASSAAALVSRSGLGAAAARTRRLAAARRALAPPTHSTRFLQRHAAAARPRSAFSFRASSTIRGQLQRNPLTQGQGDTESQRQSFSEGHAVVQEHSRTRLEGDPNLQRLQPIRALAGSSASSPTETRSQSQWSESQSAKGLLGGQLRLWLKQQKQTSKRERQTSALHYCQPSLTVTKLFDAETDEWCAHFTHSLVVWHASCWAWTRFSVQRTFNIYLVKVDFRNPKAKWQSSPRTHTTLRLYTTEASLSNIFSEAGIICSNLTARTGKVLETRSSQACFWKTNWWRSLTWSVGAGLASTWTGEEGRRALQLESVWATIAHWANVVERASGDTAGSDFLPTPPCKTDVSHLHAAHASLKVRRIGIHNNSEHSVTFGCCSVKRKCLVKKETCNNSNGLFHLRVKCKEHGPETC